MDRLVLRAGHWLGKPEVSTGEGPSALAELGQVCWDTASTRDLDTKSLDMQAGHWRFPSTGVCAGGLPGLP